MNDMVEAWRSFRDATHVAPIRDPAHYEELAALAGRLIEEVGSNEAHPLAELLELVGELIRAYDERHYRVPVAGGPQVLRFLMESHGLSQSDVPEVGNQSVVSHVLAGKRQLNTRQIRALSDRFGLSPAAFSDPHRHKARSPHGRHEVNDRLQDRLRLVLVRRVAAVGQLEQFDGR